MMTGRPKDRDPVFIAPDPLVLAEAGESPTVEVRVWRDDDLIHRELCESADAAAAVVASWSEIEGVRCEVDDLSARHRPDHILEPGPDDDAADPDAARARGAGPLGEA